MSFAPFTKYCSYLILSRISYTLFFVKYVKCYVKGGGHILFCCLAIFYMFLIRFSIPSMVNSSSPRLSKLLWHPLSSQPFQDWPCYYLRNIGMFDAVIRILWCVGVLNYFIISTIDHTRSYTHPLICYMLYTTISVYADVSQLRITFQYLCSC